jgi:hypothetical protein
MAIKISGTTVINNDRELGSGLDSIYDVVSTTATSKTLVNREYCTVTAAGQTITLPDSPVAGNEVVISVGAFTNTVVSPGAGIRIMGQALAENMTIDGQNCTINLVFIDATRGWRIS